jgi:hypothetical protein
VTLIFQLSQWTKSLPFAPVEKKMPQVHNLLSKAWKFSQRLIIYMLWFLGFSGEGTQFLVFGGKELGEEEFYFYLFIYIHFFFCGVFGRRVGGPGEGGVLFIFIFILLFCFCGVFGRRVGGPGEGG